MVRQPNRHFVGSGLKKLTHKFEHTLFESQIEVLFTNLWCVFGIFQNFLLTYAKEHLMQHTVDR